MPGPIHPQYVLKDAEAQSSFTSSLTVLRTADNASFLASRIPAMKTKDPKKDTANKLLAPAIIPTAGAPISRILNHPNIISLVDIVQAPCFLGKSIHGDYSNLIVWEDMDAGCLEYLLPSPNNLPGFIDSKGWHTIAAQSFQRFSLPESLCWHVLMSISKALMWLHYGVKETEGIPGEAIQHNNNWPSILIRDVSLGQIWFKKPKPNEIYGECKLGGFRWAKITGGSIAIATRVEDASREKQLYWAPEVYKNLRSWSRPSEIWSLGAVLYTMMTGLPPPRYYSCNWQISRINDKGFSLGLRDIVAKMLDPVVEKRPNALHLVQLVKNEWRSWRANTIEGRAHVDRRDGLIRRQYNCSKGAKAVSLQSC